MPLKLTAADYSFPLLEWEQTLRLARDIGMEGMDISLFENRSHLKPAEILADPSRSAARVSAALQANGLQLADIFGIPGTSFDHIHALNQHGYSCWFALEYVWIDWEHCNEVDIVSETILLRDLFRAEYGQSFSSTV